MFVVEQNRDAQLRSLLLTGDRRREARLRSILHYNGMPIPASYVVDGVAAVHRAGAAGRAAGWRDGGRP